MTTTRPSARLAFLALLALLAGCSLLPATESLTTYTLPAPAAGSSPAEAPRAGALTAAAGPAAQTGMRLYVAEPLGNRLLSSNRILVQPVRAELGAYQGVRWTDPGTALFRDRLLQEFRGDADYVSASADETLQADLALGGDLVAFQAEQGDGAGALPTARVRYDAILWRPGDRQVVAARSFERRVPAGDRSVGGVVAAFGLAMDEMAAEVLAWTTTEGREALRRQGGAP